MQTCFGIEVLAGEAQIDRGAARRRLLPEGSAVPAPDRAAPRVRGVAGRQQVVGVQVEDRLRAARVDLREGLPVRIHVFADQSAGVVIFPQQRPARAVDIMNRIPPRHLLRARMKSNYLRITRTKNLKMRILPKFYISSNFFKIVFFRNSFNSTSDNKIFSSKITFLPVAHDIK